MLSIDDMFNVYVYIRIEEWKERRKSSEVKNGPQGKAMLNDFALTQGTNW